MNRTTHVVETGLRLVRSRAVTAVRRRRHGSRGPDVGLFDEVVRRGFAVIPAYFDDATCTRIRAEIDRMLELRPDHVTRDAVGSDLRLFGADLVSPLVASSFRADPLFDSFFTRSYAPRSVVGPTMAARLTAVPGNLGSGGGWHRDSVYGPQVKVIGYFSDVGATNGPFEFVPRSHRASAILGATARAGIAARRTRFSDDDVVRVEDVLGVERQAITGPAGTVVLVDTTMVHRGRPIETGTRYALTNYVFGGTVPRHIAALVCPPDTADA